MPELKVGGNRCKCGACGEYFNSTYAFDKHRVGKWPERRCMTVDEMRAAQMDKNRHGFWVSSQMLTWDGFSGPSHILDASEKAHIKGGSNRG